MKITKQQILSGDEQAFATLLSTCFTNNESNNKKACQHGIKQSRQIAQAIAKGDITLIWNSDSWQTFADNVTSHEQTGLSAWCMAYLQFSFCLLLPYWKYCQLDHDLHSGVAAIQERLFIEALLDHQFWMGKHPLKQLADQTQQSMLGWQPGFGKHSDALRSVFDKIIDSLQSITPGDRKSLEKLRSNSHAQFNKIQQDLERFTQRLKATEIGRAKNRASQLAVVGFSNRLLKNRQLPARLVDFLQGHLLSELQLLLIQQGLDCDNWKKVRQLLEALVVLYQLAVDNVKPDEQQQKTLLELPNQLQDFIYQNLQKSKEGDDFINLIAYDFSQIASGHEIGGLCEPEPIDVPGYLHDVDKQVSQSLLEKSRRYKEGQWFLLHDGKHSVKRCQLLLVMDDYNQLLFSNFVGQRCLVTEYENFAYLLSAKHIQPLMIHGSVTYCLHRQLEIMLKNFEQRFEQQQRDIEARKQTEIAREKHAAAAKAEAEAKAIVELREAEKQKEQMQQMAHDMRRQARLALDSLSIGSWIELQQKDETFKRAKLAVKFSATSRFVFVDEDGMTVADTHRDELVELLMQGKLKFLESDRKFADRLAKIVTDIRASQ